MAKPTFAEIAGRASQLITALRQEGATNTDIVFGIAAALEAEPLQGLVAKSPEIQDFMGRVKALALRLNEAAKEGAQLLDRMTKPKNVDPRQTGH